MRHSASSLDPLSRAGLTSTRDTNKPISRCRRLATGDWKDCTLRQGICSANLLINGEAGPTSSAETTPGGATVAASSVDRIMTDSATIYATFTSQLAKAVLLGITVGPTGWPNIWPCHLHEPTVRQAVGPLGCHIVYTVQQLAESVVRLYQPRLIITQQWRRSA